MFNDQSKCFFINLLILLMKFNHSPILCVLSFLLNDLYSRLNLYTNLVFNAFINFSFISFMLSKNSSLCSKLFIFKLFTIRRCVGYVFVYDFILHLTSWQHSLLLFFSLLDNLTLWSKQIVLSTALINFNFMAFDLLFKFNLLILKFTIHFTHYNILTSLQCFNLYQFYSATIFVINLSNRPIMSAALNSLSQPIDL